MSHPMDLTNHRIMVTGAEFGIGRETARFLSRLGAEVICVGRDAAQLQSTVASLEGTLHSCEPFDLATGDAIVPWLKDVVQRHGQLHGLAHCDEQQIYQPLADLTSVSLQEIYQTNAVSAAQLIRAIQQPDCAASGASVVLLSSAAAIVGLPTSGAYAASKAALLAMTRAFAMELVKAGIRVNAVVAGLVNSDETTPDVMTPEAFQALAAKHPLGVGQPEDVAYAIAFLLAPTSRWITGTSLVVDGAWTIP
jgi:NAD(P)-dependent dehydrogenase (short-subunit alcohol dehydrogenase family)